MPLRRAAALPLCLLLAVPAAADDPLAESLRRAEKAYDQAVEHFKAGDSKKGRKRMAQALSELASAVEDEEQARRLKADFLKMAERLRGEDPGEEPPPDGEEPSELDVSEQALREATPAAGERKAAGEIKIDPENPITRKFIEIYTQGRRKEAVEQALERSGRYRPMILEALRKAGLPEELFWLVMTESEYKLNAVSRSGAAGLWQFMPATGRKYGLEVSYWIDERFDPEKATAAAVRYLSDLYQWFGDWHLAMAAYNRGENGLGRDLQFTRSADFDDLSDRNALPNETHHYVPKFMACALIGRDPGKYGLNPRYEEPEPYDVAPIDRDLDLGLAAKAAGTTLEAIQRLNPQIRAWCTPKGRPGFPLRLPKGTKERFLETLSKIKDWNPGPDVIRHTVRRGDVLGKLAKRYRTSVREIMDANKLRSARLIRPGMVLKIRPGRGYKP